MQSLIQQRSSPIFKPADLFELTREGGRLYRGQPDDWPLIPKAWRTINVRVKPYYRSRHTSETQKALLSEFKRLSRPHVNLPDNATNLEWLAVAQHHGMSTALLDWTTSPLIAAHFALRSGSGSGTIYSIPTPPPIERGDEIDPFSLSAVRSYAPPVFTARIAAQRSVFTVHPQPDLEYAPTDAWKIHLANTTGNGLENLRRVLDRCGINDAVLQPDLDGLARYLDWQFKPSDPPPEWGDQHINA